MRPVCRAKLLLNLQFKLKKLRYIWTRLGAVAEAVLYAAVPSEALFVWPTALPSVELYPCLGVFRSERLV